MDKMIGTEEAFWLELSKLSENELRDMWRKAAEIDYRAILHALLQGDACS